MKLKLLLSILIISNSLFAQQKPELSGQIKDAKSKENLEFCSIAIYNQKDSLIIGGVTGNKGFFTIPVDAGTYHLIIRNIGYKTDTTKIFDISENKFIGVIKLEPDATALTEVTVKTRADENQLDKDVQIVTDKMRVGAASTKEVLEKVNGVTYDRFNNSIKVDNNSKVIILVDGMEKDQEYIKNLSPDRLRKIEVIRDPGGRYGLEGYSAVINIILKKDYHGTELLVNDQTLQDVDSKKTKYIPVQNNLNISLNYVYNKINLYGSYNNNINNFNFNANLKKEYDNGLVIESTPVNDRNMHVKELTNTYTLGADYYLNPKHTISFESDISAEPVKYNHTDQFFNVNYTNGSASLLNYNSQSLQTSGSLNSRNSLFYTGKLNENNLINASFNYSMYTASNTNYYSDDLLNLTNQKGKDNKNSTKFYIEYTHTFKEQMNVQIGYGNAWQGQNNSLTSDSVTSNFKYSDLRHKFYAYYSWQPKKKWGIKVGAAAETSSQDAGGIKHSYVITQPYADIKYTPSQVLDFKLKYRADNRYPDIDETNPFTSFIYEQSVKVGNPYLKPEVTHKVSMQVDILGGLLTIEPYYRFSNNYITETGMLRSDNIFQYSYNNAGNYERYGSEARVTIPFSKSIILQSDVDVFNNSIKYAGNTNNFNFWTMSTQLIYQNSKYSTVAGLKYQKNLVKNITAQGYDKGDNDFWLAFVQQPFFKEKLNVMLLYFIPTGLGVDFNQGSYLKTETYKETKSFDISILKNIVMLQVSYRFNKGKSANKTEKNIEQEEGKKKGIF
ncbi:MAG: TonB-dependent receptor [Bacteroidia bacterium]